MTQHNSHGRSHRRQFLKGIGGVTLGLPLLDAFTKTSRAAGTAPTPYLAFVINANGFQQGSFVANDGTPDASEMFWPAETGVLTRAAMEEPRRLTASEPKPFSPAGALRGTAGLADYWDRLLMIRGGIHDFDNPFCAHSANDAQVLTAAKIVKGPGHVSNVLSMGESLDTRIARELNPSAREPLTLHAGQYAAGGQEYNVPGFISYVGPMQQRPAEPSPLRAYQRIVGLVGSGPAPMPGMAETVTARRLSVNDLLRGQISNLLARKDLSAGDRARLQQHFDSVRELENNITGALSPSKIMDLETAESMLHAESNHDKIIRLHMDVMVFAFSVDYTRVATLKIGDRQDDHHFGFAGNNENFHDISHGEGPSPFEAHHMADQYHAGLYKYFLDQLSAVSTPTGSLLDQGSAIWTNQQANGGHDVSPIPFIVAGTAQGFFKKSLFVELGKTTSNARLLNTFLTAAGVRKTDGSPTEDFGDASLAKNVHTEIMA